MKEVVTDVLMWSRLSAPHGYDFNGHLMRSPEGNLCIDPVEPSEADLEQIAGIGATRILLTNRNHTRAANVLRSRLGARTSIHPKDAHHALSQGAEIDETFEVGEIIGPLQVVAIPGKSPGEVGFFWPDRKILIVGDAVVGNPPGHCALLPEKVLDDPAQLRRSVEAILALDFDTLLMGDGSSILSHGKDRLRELVTSFQA